MVYVRRNVMLPRYKTLCNVNEIELMYINATIQKIRICEYLIYQWFFFLAFKKDIQRRVELNILNEIEP